MVVVQTDVSDDGLLVWTADIDIFCIKQALKENNNTFGFFFLNYRDLEMFLSDVEGIVQVSNMVIRIQSIVIDEIRSKDMEHD